jgi:hypothetical protein
MKSVTFCKRKGLFSSWLHPPAVACGDLSILHMQNLAVWLVTRFVVDEVSLGAYATRRVGLIARLCGLGWRDSALHGR